MSSNNNQNSNNSAHDDNAHDSEFEGSANNTRRPKDVATLSDYAFTIDENVLHRCATYANNFVSKLGGEPNASRLGALLQDHPNLVAGIIDICVPRFIRDVVRLEEQAKMFSLVLQSLSKSMAADYVRYASVVRTTATRLRTENQVKRVNDELSKHDSKVEYILVDNDEPLWLLSARFPTGVVATVVRHSVYSLISCNDIFETNLDDSALFSEGIAENLLRDLGIQK